jgi:hypothetical protein
MISQTDFRTPSGDQLTTTFEPSPEMGKALLVLLDVPAIAEAARACGTTRGFAAGSIVMHWLEKAEARRNAGRR